MISWLKLNPEIKQKNLISMLVTTKSKDVLKVLFPPKADLSPAEMIRQR